jgi:leader peptidase (prepilin peptidase)/N-methyltransferase
MPLIAALAAALIGGAALAVTDGQQLQAAALGLMLAAAIEDFRSRRIPNVLVTPALVLALLGASDLGSSVGAGLALAAPLYLIALIAPGAMGMGDVKLALPAGAIAGFAGLYHLVLAISGFGAMLALIAFVRGGRKATLAYGPAIALGALLVAAL